MESSDDRVERLFHEALNLAPPARKNYIDRECGDNLSIREEVMSLLQAYDLKSDIFSFHENLLHQEEAEQSTKADVPQGKTIGDFKIIREIGRGGMGVVYEAEQSPLGRRVALKVLSSDRTVSEYAVRKFRREGEAGSRSQHPNIVTVYSVGEHEGTHFIAQELVERGYSLAHKISELKKMSVFPRGYFREAAKIVADVANALQHAHDSGVIHRDIKPSNILLTEAGHTKVTDFGLARIEDALPLSRTGEFAGTPYYMSPEQAKSKKEKIDHRTDIYSLGVTLYELLTLRRPFEGETSHEILGKIVAIDPIEPRSTNPIVPRDLNSVCLKAIEKQAEKRYQSMDEFSEDLRRFLTGDVILARPQGFKTRVWKRIRRNPVASTAVGVALIAFMVIATVVPWVIAIKEREKREAEKNTRIAIQKERDLAVAAELRALNAEENANRQRDRVREQAHIANERFQEIMRLSDLQHLSYLKKRAEELWPAYPENLAGLTSWLDIAERLIGRLEGHRAVLATWRKSALPYTEKAGLRDREEHPKWRELLEARYAKINLSERVAVLEASAKSTDTRVLESDGSTTANEKLDGFEGQLTELEEKIFILEEMVSERRTFEFPNTEDQWRHDTLAELVSGIEQLKHQDEGLLRNIHERCEFATTIEKRSISACRKEWDDAIASIANEEECPKYRGLTIQPLIGFVPIGRDNQSGLWEFAHLQTGDIPERNAEGKLILIEETGLVFVLIPGGTFNMGAVPPSNEDSPLSPNHDRDSEMNEGPVHPVTLDPFFLSKYEMTQAQWLRFTKENPSTFGPDHFIVGKQHSLLHPVEQVSWQTCNKELSKLKLRLPSESEWEYAARAGTTTVWWTGNDKATLKGAANILEISWWNFSGIKKRKYETGFNDGYGSHAPVGTYSPNAFGLHDVCGNVCEWCQDHWTSYAKTKTHCPANSMNSWHDFCRVHRGGSWSDNAWSCRSACRSSICPPQYRNFHLGLRPARSLDK